MSLIDVRPTSTSPRGWRFPSFERVTLDSGLDLVLCDLPGRPMAAVRLLLEAGAAAEPLEQAGVGVLAVRSLPEGTESFDAHRLAETMEGMGAEIRGEVSFDTMQVRMDVPASRLATALPLLAEVALRPGFRSSEVGRLIKERLDQIAQERTMPDALASRAFEQAVFVPGTSYARSIGGDEDTVGSLTRDAVAAFYQSRLAAGGATLIVAGDVSGIDVASLASAEFGSLGAASSGGSATAADGSCWSTVLGRCSRRWPSATSGRGGASPTTSQRGPWPCALAASSGRG
jgi:predicted Zn-dependent peptidase